MKTAPKILLLAFVASVAPAREVVVPDSIGLRNLDPQEKAIYEKARTESLSVVERCKQGGSCLQDLEAMVDAIEDLDYLFEAARSSLVSDLSEDLIHAFAATDPIFIKLFESDSPDLKDLAASALFGDEGWSATPQLDQSFKDLLQDPADGSRNVIWRRQPNRRDNARARARRVDRA